MDPIATKLSPKDAQITKNYLARAQSRNYMPFAQPYFNQLYLSCFDSKLQYVWSTGFLTALASKPYMVWPKKTHGR